MANAVPKLIAYRLLRPAVENPEPLYIVCREDNAEQLTTHALDVVIADTPAPPHVRVKVFNHLLGDSDTAFFRAAEAGGTVAPSLSPVVERRASAPAHGECRLAPRA